MLKMLLFFMCEAPQKNSTNFKAIFGHFTLFHLKNWPYLQKPEFGNLAKTRFWLLLVNNSLCSIPLSWTRSYIEETPGDRGVFLDLSMELKYGGGCVLTMGQTVLQIQTFFTNTKFCKYMIYPQVVLLLLWSSVGQKVHWTPYTTQQSI